MKNLKSGIAIGLFSAAVLTLTGCGAINGSFSPLAGGDPSGTTSVDVSVDPSCPVVSIPADLLPDPSATPVKTYPVPAGVPSGDFDVLSATLNGAPLDWAAKPGVVTVYFAGGTQPDVIWFGVDVTNAINNQFTVSGNTLTPQAESPRTTSVACEGPNCPPEQMFYPMLSAPVTFTVTDPTHVTVTGSGMVLQLQARA